jgi:hypothetical protein
MQRKNLPVGIETFREIRENGHYYVDKTPLILDLIEQGKPYFLSRPRRFGKSLLLDTIKELFEGNKALFTGLHAEAHWDWSVTHPVVRLSFGAGVLKTPEDLVVAIDGQLSRLEQEFGIQQRCKRAVSRLADLFETLHDRTGQRVVVLVDEYDKPILDNLTDPECAQAMRDTLWDLYSVLKDADAHLHFVFVAGVSKLLRAGIFSGLNNLLDITLSTKYSTLCGYTDHDVDTVFAPELPGLDRERIKRWYNGYNWRGESVYNPFDLLLLFRKRQFKAYWFETGTPTFLVTYLAQKQFFTPNLAHLISSWELLSAFDVDHIEPEALLWQAGYLTIHEVQEVSEGQWFYTLGYPNREVESALNASLLSSYGVSLQASGDARRRLPSLLANGDTAGLEAHMHALFASIPHDWYRNNPIAQFEGFYASVFYSHLAALGMDTRVEDATNKGRIDLALRTGDRLYLFEFKVVEQTPAGRAIAQLQSKGYADKYRAPGVTITLVGIAFSRDARNLVRFETAEA